MGEMLINSIQIKGIREGLLIVLAEGSFQDRERELLDHIDHQKTFFQGARLALDTGAMSIKTTELCDLRDRLSDRGIALWAVLSREQLTETAARMLGLVTRLGPTDPVTQLDQGRSGPVNEMNALLVQKTLRSGAHLENDGHITVLGDVKPGAEVSATGSVIIWGRLLGNVHAGSRGDTSAVICALEMTPAFIHIAGLINQLPAHKGRQQPEMARVIEEKIVIEAWKVKNE